VVLCPPHHANLLYVRAGDWGNEFQGSSFNPDAPDFEAYPDARKATFLRTTIHAADVLFIPAGWFHQVTNAVLTFAVNFYVGYRHPVVLDDQPPSVARPG
jgi:hypothetical protein